MDAAIAVSNVTRRFGETVAVNRLSLDVGRGEIFALVGPDGAGKTTLIRLMCGALRLDEGSLQLDGIDVAIHAAQVQATVGYMPQRFSLYPDLSVIENLRFYGDIFGVAAAEFGRRADDLLDDFGLSAFRSRLAEELSGGMKQKLALACTLIHTPATILLDEPTAGVDPLSRREFWRILYRINRRGTTIFVSTPYMDEAERANRVALIMRGSIVDCGPPEELKRALREDVIEISCDQRSRARSALRDDPAVRSVEIFGSTLHALVDSAASAIAEMERRLRDAGVANAQLRKVEPSLEDTFVARLTS
jgi:ABC-2 type transport system ATP-binding protein